LLLFFVLIGARALLPFAVSVTETRISQTHSRWSHHTLLKR
jgi:hypothetical protein